MPNVIIKVDCYGSRYYKAGEKLELSEKEYKLITRHCSIVKEQTDTKPDPLAALTLRATDLGITIPEKATKAVLEKLISQKMAEEKKKRDDLEKAATDLGIKFNAEISSEELLKLIEEKKKPGQQNQ